MLGEGGSCGGRLIYGVSRSAHMVLAKRKDLSPNPKAEGEDGMSVLVKDADWKNRRQGGGQRLGNKFPLWGDRRCLWGGWRYTWPLEVGKFLFSSMQRSGERKPASP